MTRTGVAMAKRLYLLFAVVAYAVFLATFLYLVAFVGDLALVPKTVDSGPTGSAAAAVLVDVLLIALFGVQHSIMARQGFKRVWTQFVPKPVERSVYVLFASAALILLFLFWQPIAGDVWNITNPLAATSMWTLFAAGWLIVLLSTFLINHFELFGLQQVYHHARGHAPAEPQFRQPFLYKFVRHPLYSGFLIAFWATPSMSYGHLLLAAGMSGYILIAIRHEERDLVQLFGADYEGYRMKVGMLTPRVRRG